MVDRKPNLDDFRDVLELLAGRYSQVEGQGEKSADWVRKSIAGADLKLHALRFVLSRISSGSHARLLDIGTMIGSLPLYASRFGIESAAVDNGDYAEDCGVILREYGVDYRVCDIGRGHLPFADGTFDFVTYMDVIEHHAYSSKRVLLEARRALAPGGYLIITTPNHASIYNRLSLLSGGSVNDPFDYFFETSANQSVYLGHHREYTPAELRAALERTGFRVVQCAVKEEGLRPEFQAFRVDCRHGWVPAVRAHGKYLIAGVLGYLWTGLSLPFGRTLWAVGEKVDK